ncbi:MAG: aldo/keto reductase [Sulfolobales archaeon]
MSYLMEYRELGWTGEKISVVGLGAWQFSDAWGVLDYENAKKIIEASFSSGVNLIDTAAVYGRGKSEEFVGRAVRELGIRDKVIIATKLPGEFMNEYDVFKGTERSLARLGVDVIDLMQVHWPPAWHNFPTCEYMRALERLVKLGKIRYIGLSDFPVELIESARQCLSSIDIVSIQIRYNLAERYAEKEHIPYAEREGLTVLAWSPLAKGALSGKYDPKNPPTFSDVRSGEAVFHPENLAKLEPLINAVKELSKKYNATPTQISLRWLIQYSPVVVPIPGAKSPDQARENAGAGSFSLSFEDLVLLDRISRGIRISYVTW